MEKELQQTLSQVPMYSKMGRYISNKILKYNKSNSPTHHIAKVMAPPPYDYLRPQKSKELNQMKTCKGSFSLEKDRFGKTYSNDMYLTQPPVGYYKVNHSYIDKNPRQYNFDRSVPHFSRQKFSCQEVTPVEKDFPDMTTFKPQVKGMVELKRGVGRQNVDASVRRFLEDPHEERFYKAKDYRSNVENPKCRVNLFKNLSRGSQMFKSAEFTPDYDYNAQTIKKRLDTLGIPFQHQPPRNNQFLVAKTGISQCFESDLSNPSPKIQNWKKSVSREKLGLLPAYMDKTINSRVNLMQINQKQLQMNCTDMKKKQIKNKVKKKKNKDLDEYVQDDDEKENA